MKRTIVVLLLLATSTYGQQKNSRTDVTIPVPGSSGTVTLSLEEYNRLSELAARKPKITDAPPMPFVLSNAAFKLRVENQSLTGVVDIDGALLEKGSVKVPLTTGLTILEARQAGNPLPMMQEGQTHAGIMSGPGPFSVSLNVASALTVEAGRASFVIPVPSASSSLLTLDLLGSHANVRVEPGLITSSTTANGHTIIEATLEPGKPTRVWWTTREIAAPVSQREVRFLSDIKSLISVGDSQMSITSLCDVTVIQGDAMEFRMPVPAGFELTEATGATLDSSEIQAGVLVLRVREPAKRNHQFLVALERANKESKVDAPLLQLTGSQHETGELLVEGVGSMELTPKESGGLRRIDVRETGAITRSLARYPLQAAFRYNRRPGDMPKLQLEWTQFPDSSVLSAVAERATITTLTNIEGKSLTEVTMQVRNHSQPYVKVQLPTGAQLLSAEVEGERVKPVLGDDGGRVPLLRAGFNPSGVYTVSFVYMSTGTRFEKSGAYEMGLPKLDIPINLLTWEISLPDRLEVKQFGGNALAAELFPMGAQYALENNYVLDGVDANAWNQSVELSEMGPGQIGGIIADPNGAVVPGVVVTVVNKQTGTSLSATSDGDGRWVVSGMPAGPVTVTIAPTGGFSAYQQEFAVNGSRGVRLGTTLSVAGASASVDVTSDVRTSERESQRIEDQARKDRAAQMNAPSQNVFSLQRKVAGILPIRVDVPRAGKSYRFARPLVMEEETTITFQYKSK